MITLPSSYNDAVPFTGEFETLPVGGYVCKIMKAEQDRTKNGDPVLILSLDIAEGEYTDFYRRQYASRKDENKRWGCTYRQLITDKSVNFLKGLITCIEKSNDMHWNGEEAALKGKLVGMLFGREQYRNAHRDLRWSVKPVQPRTIDVIRSGEFELPKDKPMFGENAVPGMDVYQALSINDQDLPF